MPATARSKTRRRVARASRDQPAANRGRLGPNRAILQPATTQKQLQVTFHQMLRAQEEERKRISRELHDVVVQTLMGINVRLATLKRQAVDPASDLVQQLGRTQELVQHAVQVVDQFVAELRPSVLDDLGLIPALKSFIKALMNRTESCIEFHAFAGVEHLAADQRTVLFRVTQEALANLSKYARPDLVTVSIQPHNGAACLEIKHHSSRPTGRKPNANGTGRFDLPGMRERVEMVGGTFVIEAGENRDTTIRAEIPLNKTAPRGRRSAKPATLLLPDR